MKPWYAYSTPEGIKLIEGDKMPVMKHWPEGTPMLTDYNVALQRAKDSAIIVQNAWNAVELIAAHDIIGPQPDTIYGPFSLRYEIQSKCELWCSDCKAFDWSTCKDKQVAILYDDAEKEESQGDIIKPDFRQYAKKYALTLVDEVEGTPQYVCFQAGANYGWDQCMKAIKEKFTITRKQ